MDAGATLLWDCTAKGTPIPVLTWAKDGVKFQSGTAEHISILSNSSLVIAGVKPEDAGKYQCHARNGVGAHVVQATLTVRGETLWCFLVPVPSMFNCYEKSLSTFVNSNCNPFFTRVKPLNCRLFIHVSFCV